ncbi:hypothetical protein ACFL3H_04210 [Gemmatimonadota bacterium]
MVAGQGPTPHLYHHYCLYGLLLRSAWVIPSPEADPDTPDIELNEAPESFFSDLLIKAGTGRLWRSNEDDRFTSCELSDGSDYLRWSGLFEFHVSSGGNVISCRQLESASTESFQTYLLGQVLSWALLKRQVEQLHASVVEVDGQAIGFLGDSGYGKSTLSAAFLKAGHRLLTDDMLVLEKTMVGYQAYPGLPRIKLDPGIARKILGGDIRGVPMNPDTGKEVLPLDADRSAAAGGSVPLQVLYVLASPGDTCSDKEVTIRSLPPSEACMELVRNTFNTFIDDRGRLRNQFDFSTDVAKRVPVKMLSYPRRLDHLPEVVESVISQQSV